MKTDAVKAHIEAIVTEYIRLWPDDYGNVKRSVAIEKDGLADPRFSQVKGTSFLLRKLTDYPEQLYYMLVNQLTDEEKDWWKSVAGGRWFARRFPTFTLPDKV